MLALTAGLFSYSSGIFTETSSKAGKGSCYLNGVPIMSHQLQEDPLDPLSILVFLLGGATKIRCPGTAALLEILGHLPSTLHLDPFFLHSSSGASLPV